jgi:hypothetical protein
MKTSNRKRTKVMITAFAASVLVGAFSSAAMAQSTPVGLGPMGNNPVANFDQGYLDHHPEVAQQLSANPNLVDDPQFMQRHPGLEKYMAHHPEVATQLKENPSGFMSNESQFNGAGGDHSGMGGNGQGAVGRFDRGYLDEHPEVAQQLAKDPSLADNPQYLASHPDLQKYLTNHPQVQQDLANHPNQFMGRENGLNGGYGAGNGYGAHTIGNTDKFLASHPEMAQQLNHDPKLIDNQEYLTKHPELQQYLQNHPHAEQRWQSHPRSYMRRADRYRWNH